MSNKRALFDLIVQHQIVGVVREETSEEGWEVAAAYVKGGIRFLEITLTTPDAFSLMARVVGELGEKGVIVVAGTVRNGNDAASSRRAGARVLVSPHTDMRVIEYATEHDLLCIAGAATPTEIIHAWEAGADIVKVYPAPHLGGPSYIGTIRQPIRDVPMLAGGPIPLDAIDSYLEAGAIAVNLGASLAVPELVETKRWDEIARRAMLAVSIAGSRREALSGSDSMVH